MFGAVVVPFILGHFNAAGGDIAGIVGIARRNKKRGRVAVISRDDFNGFDNKGRVFGGGGVGLSLGGLHGSLLGGGF